MRTRAPALIAVTAFAMAVAVLAVFAARSDDHRLVKLPVAALGGASADEAGLSAPQARSSLAYWAPVEYRVEGTLPDLPGTAPAYKLGSATTAAAVQHLAEALGLKGDVQADADGWLVRAGGRELRVEAISGLPWYMSSTCPEAPVSPDGQTFVTCSAGASGAGVATAPAVPADGGSTGSPASAGAAGPATAGGATTGAATMPGDGSAGSARSAGAATMPTGGSGGSAGPATTVVGCPPHAECVVPDPAPAGAAPVPVGCPPGAACLTAPVPGCEAATATCGPASPPPCAPDAKCIAPALVPVPPPGVAVDPMPMPKPPRPADLPSEQEAGRMARAAFARLGVGTEGFVLEDGWATWEARVEARVDGLPVVGLGTSLSIGAKGEIERANGFLAAPDRIGDYPLVGVQAGLKRLTTGFGAGSGPRTMVATDDTAVRQDLPEPGIAVCDDPAVKCVTPPQPLLPPQVITGVHLALLQTGDVLVPAYAFELAEGGGAVPVPAVTDEWLDQQGSTSGK